MPDGTLDRKKLRRIIFSNPKSKKGLELILHPAIEIEVHKRLRLVESPYCILVIPLFAESDSYEWVDRVLLVDVPENVQLQRVMARDGVSLDDAKAILAAQANREERLAIADDVIENTGSLDELKARVRQLHEVYLELSEGCEVSG